MASTEASKERHILIGSGELCFWCWQPTRDRPVAYSDKGCTLVLCEKHKGLEISAYWGMMWWAESKHNPYSYKNRRNAAKK